MSHSIKNYMGLFSSKYPVGNSKLQSKLCQPSIILLECNRSMPFKIWLYKQSEFLKIMS